MERREIYLANHSLGRPMDQTADDLREYADLWYAAMDGAWGAWMAEVSAFRARVALLLGLSRADAVVPKSSAGHALRTVIGALPTKTPRIVATRGEFDSIDFVLKVYRERERASVSFVDPGADGLFDPGAIAARVAVEKPDLAVVSHVCYATGQMLDPGPIAAACRSAGTLLVLDVYHSFGAMAVGMEALGADFAVGGSYKYVRGGAGPCFLAVHPRHLGGTTTLMPIDTGWFAKRDTFGYRRPERPEFSDGGDAWLESTPAPVLAYQARAGLQLLTAIGVDRLRAYNVEQQAFLAGALARAGVRPRLIEPRGAFLLIASEDADGACRRLREGGVNSDARLGHVRLCPDLLTTRDEMERAAAVVGERLGSAG